MDKVLKLVFIFLLLLSKQALSNTIDDLKTDGEVNAFVKAQNPDFVKYNDGKFEIRATNLIAKDLSCNGIFESWQIRNWEKADITNDGLTDQFLSLITLLSLDIMKTPGMILNLLK